MRTYGIFKIDENNGVACYMLCLKENGRVQWEILYASEAGRQAAIRDGENWIDGKFDPSELPELKMEIEL